MGVKRYRLVARAAGLAYLIPAGFPSQTTTNAVLIPGVVVPTVEHRPRMIPNLPLLAAAITSLVTAALYAYIGRIVYQREVSEAGRLANGMFVTWWASLALVTAISGLYNIPAVFFTPDFSFTIALVDFLLILIVAAIWSLQVYLLYLYTGHNRFFWSLTAAYALVAFALLWYVVWLDPVSLTNAPTGVQIQYSRDQVPAAQLAFGLVLAVPALAAAIAYGTLYFRVDERASRYRIAMVSGSFLFWFGYSLAGTLTGFNQNPSLELTIVNDIVGLAAPTLVLMAYRPPAWLAAKLDSTSA